MITQLNPSMDVLTPLGRAFAVLLQASEWEVYWGCFQRDTGEMWWWPNHLIRMAPSITDGHVKTTPIKLPPEMQERIDAVRARNQ